MIADRPAKYPPPKVIAVDVDGTLCLRGELNPRVVDWCARRRKEGYSTMLWSMRGQAYAKKAAEFFRVSHLFDVIVSKPGVILDDRGWTWVRDTRIVRSLDD